MQVEIVAGLALTAALLLAGCSKTEEPEGVIPQGYEDAMKKAGDVESKLDAAAQQQLQDLD